MQIFLIIELVTSTAAVCSALSAPHETLPCECRPWLLLLLPPLAKCPPLSGHGSWASPVPGSLLAAVAGVTGRLGPTDRPESWPAVRPGPASAVLVLLATLATLLVLAARLVLSPSSLSAVQSLAVLETTTRITTASLTTSSTTSSTAAAVLLISVAYTFKICQ